MDYSSRRAPERDEVVLPFPKRLTLSEALKHSDSHAGSAHPNYDLLTIVAGIHPKSPGFQSVSIEPHFGNLQRVNAALPIPQGMLEVQLNRTAAGVTAGVTTGVSGELIWKGNKHALREPRPEIHLP